MEMKELQIRWTELPASFQRLYTHLLRYPTERNNAYITGYKDALKDCKLLQGESAKAADKLLVLTKEPGHCIEFLAFLESL